MDQSCMTCVAACSVNFDIFTVHPEISLPCVRYKKQPELAR